MTGRPASSSASAEDYDVLVVDRMLPKRDGLSLIAELRAAGNRVPVLILSALGQVDDRVTGLARRRRRLSAKALCLLRAAGARRGAGPAERAEGGGDRLRVADLELDRLARKVQRGGEPIILQPREFRLLEYLMKNAGTVVTRTMLLEKVWDYHFDPQTNVIDVHMSRLRAKIDKGFDRPLLHTVRGSGYVMRDDA